MNNLKFRAWLKHEKKMVDVLEIDFRLLQIHYNCKVSEGIVRLDRSHFCNSIIMQSTGLKDKNGVEIFDGDVVKITFGEQTSKNDTFTHVASVEKPGLDWMAIRTDGFHHNSRLNAYHNAVYEVIGNIHEYRFSEVNSNE